MVVTGYTRGVKMDSHLCSVLQCLRELIPWLTIVRCGGSIDLNIFDR